MFTLLADAPPGYVIFASWLYDSRTGLTGSTHEWLMHARCLAFGGDHLALEHMTCLAHGVSTPK